MASVVNMSDRLRNLAFYINLEEKIVMNHDHSPETVRMRNQPIGSDFKI